MLKKKTDSLFSKKITDFWGLITIILALAAFFTGKTDAHSFFEGITLSNFLFTLLKSITAYVITILLIVFSFLMVFDFLLLIFGITFPIANFLWNKTFNNTVVNWWWQDSLSQNIFLSVLLLYFLSSYEIKIKKKTYSLFYKKVGTKLDSFSLGIFSQTYTKSEGIHIGFIIIQKDKDIERIEDQ